MKNKLLVTASILGLLVFMFAVVVPWSIEKSAQTAKHNQEVVDAASQCEGDLQQLALASYMTHRHGTGAFVEAVYSHRTSVAKVVKKWGCLPTIPLEAR